MITQNNDLKSILETLSALLVTHPWVVRPLKEL